MRNYEHNKSPPHLINVATLPCELDNGHVLQLQLNQTVCLCVCLLARLLKNACMDLDEMLRVDRCRDMDELVNF